MDTSTQRCTLCQQVFPLTPEYWHRDSGRKCGFRTRCRECELAIKRGDLVVLKSRIEGDPDILKFCHTCQTWMPATTEYFSVHKGGLHGLRTPCKSCCSLIKRGLLVTIDPFKCEDGYKRCVQCQECKPATPEYFETDKRSLDGLGSPCRTCSRENGKKKRAANPEKKREEGRVYREKFPDKMRFFRNRWKQEHPEKGSAYSHTRNAKKRNLPYQWEGDDILCMMDYWEHRCCICGQPADFWHVIAYDHWIPISDQRPDNPGTVPWNMLPMCHSKAGANGLCGCNNSKGNKDPRQWITEKLGKKAAGKKLAEIEAYFEWIRKQR